MCTPTASRFRPELISKDSHKLLFISQICLATLMTPSLLAATVVWTGADATSNVNTNWSDANNWSGGTPAAANSIYFFDQGATASHGVINNIVATNTTILFLQYGNTNGSHTTQINSGVKLVVSNRAAANLLFAGTGTDNGASQASYSTIKGAGTFSVVGTNSASTFIVQQGSASSGSLMATLDLSGLANFNLTAGQLEVGAATPNADVFNHLSGTFYLAGTNNIRVNGAAPAVDVGDAVNNGGTSFLYLGQTNAIFADTLTVAHSKATATFAFNPALAGGNPTMNLNGNTNARVSILTVGDFSTQSTSGSTTAGLMDLTAGTVSALVDACYVGRGQNGSGGGPTTGTLRVGAGTFNVNTLNVGYMNVSTDTGTVTGSVSLINGTLIVNNNLLLANNAGATAACSGTLAETNGTLLANNIVTGGGTSKVILSGGLLAVSNTLATPSAPLTSLTVNQGATFQFWVANQQTNAATTSLVSDNTGVINVATLPIVLTYPSKFPLIYCPSGGASGVRFAVGSLPNSYQGTISNDNTSIIWLVITNGPPLPKTDVWFGAINNNWDTTTLNWQSNALPVAYSENDLVVFNDSAQTTNVNLVGSAPHTPFSWTVTNNVLDYKLTGTNSVSGTTSLAKSGSGSLTLAESGDSFTGGITVNGGTLVLDETNSTISGGLSIGAGATAQIGNNDAFGSLPSGAVINNGTLVFSQTITDVVSTAISGSGSLVQNGSGTLALSGATAYTGSTIVLRGTLDLSGELGATFPGSLNMTNAAITVSATNVTFSALNLGGSSNTVNVSSLPPILFYPTNVTLIQSSNGITGYNFVLGKLPAVTPAYAGTLVQSDDAVVLALTSGPLAGVNTTVSFSPTNPGAPLNPAFCGLSYEKSQLTAHLFVSNDVSLISMFSQIAPAVLRIGGNSVDTTCWGGLSNKTPITASEVDAFAGFVKALPANWHVIYGINMSVNNPTNCAAEAAYVANALGPSLLGFEIGNECDLYHGNGIRPTSYTYSDFLPEWQALAAAITNTVPGWAATNGGNGWTLTGPASAGDVSSYTVPFAGNEAGVISLLTQHYYRANGQSPSSTMQLLLQPDSNLPGEVQTLTSAANANNLPLGFRMDECGSFYNGGAPNISDAYGAALWSLDYMFTLAVNGAQGLNFHGGGSGTGYTPIADNGTMVVQARPEFYGLKMFSLLPHGNVIPATVSLASNINFTAYGVRWPGGISALLNNKETNSYANVSVNLGPGVTGAQLIELTGPALDSTNGYTLGGAVINPDGSWSGGVQEILPATNGQVNLFVPPITAILLSPILPGTNLSFSANGNLLTLSWPTNYVGWLLQSNSVGLNSPNWFDVPGSESTNTLRFTIDSTKTNVFYRMVLP
ncbi:MAG TPA: autotransporter-associated beta strand repeat-containing protein [Verrucomicrobiae bacterium]|nr:autotransporter-associated beta strand repeat-containing protein [Verrucomicrobiae bacterium]